MRELLDKLLELLGIAQPIPVRIKSGKDKRNKKHN